MSVRLIGRAKMKFVIRRLHTTPQSHGGRYQVAQQSDGYAGAHYVVRDEGCSYELCSVSSIWYLGSSYIQAVEHFSYSQPPACLGIECVDPELQSGKNSTCGNLCKVVGPVMVGNPINMFTGGKEEHVYDFRATQGHLSFSRYYSSEISFYNPGDLLGRRWRHNYQSKLVEYIIDGKRVVLLSRPSGAYFFFRASDNQWLGDPDVDDELSSIKFDDGSVGWLVDTSSGEKEYYDRAGVLISVAYQDGDLINLSYNGDG